MDSFQKIEKRLSALEQRNKRVELDKRWETSLTRKFLIAVFTYVSVVLYFFAVEVDRPFLSAIVPTVGFLLSTLYLPFFRKLWERNL
jgi:hypothetical protein